MLIHQTLERLHELHLTGMAQALEEQLRMHDVDTFAFEDRLALLLEREATVRDDRRLTRLLQVAKLHVPRRVYPKLLERLAKTQLLVLDDFGLAALVTVNEPISSRSSTTATPSARPSSPASSRSITGTTCSETPPSPTP